jgi:hypothetical protein
MVRGHSGLDLVARDKETASACDRCYRAFWCGADSGDGVISPSISVLSAVEGGDLSAYFAALLSRQQ